MPTISCCIIAKDEGLLLPNLLKSIKPVVDEIVIAVDTKTTDKTKKIAQDAGAIVYDYEWKDDFADARNVAKSKATKEWILFLDGDSRIAKKDLVDLKKVLDEHKDVVAVSFPHRYYTKSENKTGYANWKPITKEEKQKIVKEFPEVEQFDGYFDIFPMTYLMKNHEKIFFTGKVHEDIQPSIVEWNKEEPEKLILNCKMPLHHLHFIKNKSYVNTKQEYYFKLSKEKFLTNPDAKIALDCAVGSLTFDKNEAETFRYLVASLKFQELEEKRMKRIQLLVEKKQYIAALHEIMTAIDVKKHNPNDIFNLVKAFYQTQAYRAAIIVVKRLFVVAPREPALIEYLGVCYDKINYTDDAIQVFEHGSTVYPNNASFYFNLGALYEKKKEWLKAAAAFQHAVSKGHKLKEQLPSRIRILRDRAAKGHVSYNVNVGGNTA